MQPQRDYVEGMETFDSLLHAVREDHKPSLAGALITAMLNKFATGIAIGCGIAVGLAIARAGVGL